jgi:hypothetical protein
LPARAFRPLLVAPGRTLLGVGFVDHRDGDLGHFRAASLFVTARPARVPLGLGAGYGALAIARRRLPAFVFQQVTSDPEVKERMTREWGFPCSAQPIDVERDGAVARCQVVMHGRHVLTLAMPARGEATLRSSRTEWLSYVDGRPHRALGERSGDGVARGSGRRVELLLGDHPLADRLRRLGLPKRPISSTWIEHARGRLDAPVPLRAGSIALR